MAADGGALGRGDARSIPLADDSVDLVVTSVPYFSVRDYEDGGGTLDGQIGTEDSPAAFLEALWDVTAELKRVTKPEGSIFVNLGDKMSGFETSAGGQGDGGTMRTRAIARARDNAKERARERGYGGGQDRRAEQRHRAAAARARNEVQRGDRNGDREKQRAAARRMNHGLPVKSLMGIPWAYALGCTGMLAVLGGPDLGLDLTLRAEIVWDKPNGLPESVQDRVKRSHEQWFHLTKSRFYGAGLDEIREPLAPGTIERYAFGYGDRSKTNAQRLTVNQDLGGDWTANPLGKVPGSVWTIPTEPLVCPDYFVEDCYGEKMLNRDVLWTWAEVQHRNNPGKPVMVREIDHFAAFPQEWPRRLILGWSPNGICLECGQGRWPVAEKQQEPTGHKRTVGSKLADMNAIRNPGGFQDGYESTRVLSTIVGYACACDDTSAPTRPAIVLDPFVGTGTTVMVARALGRYGIGLDLSSDYLKLARWRVWTSGQARKAIDRTNQENQGVLL